MRILFCTNVFEVIENGPVKFANLILEINHLYPEHEVHVLTEDTSGTNPYVHKVYMKKAWKTSFFGQFIRMWVYHRHAMRLRQQYPFDILVYNNALVGMVSAMAFPRTVGMINDDNNAGASFGTFSYSKGWLKGWLYRHVEHFMARRAYRIVVNSDYLRDTVIKAYKLPKDKVLRLYKGVESEVQRVARGEMDPTSVIRILFVKNDYRRGGLSTLADALSRLPYQFVLTIIGPNEADREAIGAMFGEVANTTINNMGKQTQDEVFRQMTQADIFCVPSYREALGVANLEAMARGIPVITTHVGGIPEVLDEGRCGWMVPPGDATALARALQECISSPDLRRQKLEAAHKRVNAFSKENLFNDFLTLLSD